MRHKTKQFITSHLFVHSPFGLLRFVNGASDGLLNPGPPEFNLNIVYCGFDLVEGLVDILDPHFGRLRRTLR